MYKITVFCVLIGNELERKKNMGWGGDDIGMTHS